MKFRGIVGLAVFAFAALVSGARDAHADGYSSTVTSPQPNFSCVDNVSIGGTTTWT